MLRFGTTSRARLAAAVIAVTVIASGCGTSREHVSGGPTNDPITVSTQPSTQPSPPSPSSPSPSASAPAPSRSASAPTSLSPAPPVTTAAAPTSVGTRPVAPTHSATRPPPSRSPSPSPSASPKPTPPSQSQLAAALLTAADLGADFTAVSPQGGVIGNGGFGGCTTLNANPDGTVESAPAAFTDSASATGLSVSEVLFLVEPADVANAMTAYSQLPTTCATFEATVSGLPFTFTAAPLVVAQHGDATTATRLTATTTYDNEVITLYLDLEFIQDDDTIICVIVSNATTPDIDETQNASADAYAVYTEAVATW